MVMLRLPSQARLPFRDMSIETTNYQTGTMSQYYLHLVLCTAITSCCGVQPSLQHIHITWDTKLVSHVCSLLKLSSLT